MQSSIFVKISVYNKPKCTVKLHIKISYLTKYVQWLQLKVEIWQANISQMPSWHYVWCMIFVVPRKYTYIELRWKCIYQHYHFCLLTSAIVLQAMQRVLVSIYETYLYSEAFERYTCCYTNIRVNSISHISASYSVLSRINIHFIHWICEKI